MIFYFLKELYDTTVAVDLFIYKIPQDSMFSTFCLVTEAAAKMRLIQILVKCYFHFFNIYFLSRKFQKTTALFDWAGCKCKEKTATRQKKY